MIFPAIISSGRMVASRTSKMREVFSSMMDRATFIAIEHDHHIHQEEEHGNADLRGLAIDAVAVHGRWRSGPAAFMASRAALRCPWRASDHA